MLRFVKKTFASSFILALTAASTTTFFPSNFAEAQGRPVQGRVLQIHSCTENHGVLAGHTMAVARVYNDRAASAPSTFIIYSTYPGHGLNRPELLQMAQESKSRGRYLNVYASSQRGSNICGVTSPSRYHFVRDMRYAN